jgi:hypothetical protein
VKPTFAAMIQGSEKGSFKSNPSQTGSTPWHREVTWLI